MRNLKLKEAEGALASVAQLFGIAPKGSIPDEGTCQGCGSIPGWSVTGGSQSMFYSRIDVSLPLPLSLQKNAHKIYIF